MHYLLIRNYVNFDWFEDAMLSFHLYVLDRRIKR